MSIVVVGSSNTDMIVKVPRIPKPGETILGGQFSTAAGGKGANQAVAAARAGGEVTFIARLGQDMFGDKAIEGFIKDNINVDYVLRDPEEPSGVAEIFVADDGENSIAVASGANAKLMPADIKAAGTTISGASILLMQLEIPLETVEEAARIASFHNVRVILNPAPARSLPDQLLAIVDILTPNETEAELLTGIKVTDDESTKKAAGKLHDKGVEIVIITLGARGVYVSSPGVSEFVPSFKVESVDSTAAGDVFNGALAVALEKNQPLIEAIRFANAAGALSVTKLGAQPSAPNRVEIADFIASNK